MRYHGEKAIQKTQIIRLSANKEQILIRSVCDRQTSGKKPTSWIIKVPLKAFEYEKGKYGAVKFPRGLAREEITF